MSAKISVMKNNINGIGGVIISSRRAGAHGGAQRSALAAKIMALAS